MKTTLTRSEMEAIGKMVVALVKHWEPTDDLYDMLLNRMMQRLQTDILRKIIEPKKQYKMSWHPERALAFACIMSTQLDDLKKYPFEYNLLLKLINQIHQEYAWKPEPTFSQS